MQISREKEIDIKGKKEKIKVTFEIPESAFRSSDELKEEFGDSGIGDKSIEDILDEKYGRVCGLLTCYLAATAYSGNHFDDSLDMLQVSIGEAGRYMGKFLREYRENEKMS